MAANIISTSPVAENFIVSSATTVAIIPNTIYICTATTTATYTLPIGATPGSIFCVTRTSSGNFSIAQNSGQQIFIASGSSTAGVTGTAVSTTIGDSLWLCTSDGSAWWAISDVGNITLS